MSETRPWEDLFHVQNIDIVEETPTLRVLDMTLEPGDTVPWHWHREISDRFYCLKGHVEIESRAPHKLYRLTGGDDCAVDAKVAHEVRNIGDATARLLLIQGGGPYDYHPVGREV